MKTMTTETMGERCEGCRFWQADTVPPNTMGDKSGECRRYPPNKGIPTRPGGWCGEFQLQPDEEHKQPDLIMGAQRLTEGYYPEEGDND